MPAQQHKLTIRDSSVRMFRGGSGEPLLYLHGSGGLVGWLPFFDKLAADREVLVPEHPGFGLSEAPAWIRKVTDMAMYYLEVLDHLDLDGVHLVGHSLGGWIAAEVAIRNSTRLKTLSLLAPAGIRIKGVPIGDNFIASPEENIRNLFYDHSLAERALAQLREAPPEAAEGALQDRFMAARLGWEPRWFNPDLERWLHRIRLPTLVLWGADDKLLPSQYAALWGERVPDAVVEVVERCGHLLPVEKADWTADKINTFIGGR